jgi:antitoxin ParD1/3/4
MPTKNISLTAELDAFVDELVASGRYQNASEVVRASLRVLRLEEDQEEAHLAGIRAAIADLDKGASISHEEAGRRFRQAAGIKTKRVAAG